MRSVSAQHQAHRKTQQKAHRRQQQKKRQQARRNHLRRKLPDGNREVPPAWSRIFEWVRQVWQFQLEPVGNPICG